MLTNDSAIPNIVAVDPQAATGMVTAIPSGFQTMIKKRMKAQTKWMKLKKNKSKNINS